MALLCSNRELASVILRKPLEELDRREHRVSVTHTFTRSPGGPSAGYHRHIDAPMIDDVIEELASRSPAPQSVLVPRPWGRRRERRWPRSTSRRIASKANCTGDLAQCTHRTGQGTTHLPHFPKRDWTGRQSESTLIY